MKGPLTWHSPIESNSTKPLFDRLAARNHRCARWKDCRGCGVNVVESLEVTFAEHFSVQEVVSRSHGGPNLIEGWLCCCHG